MKKVLVLLLLAAVVVPAFADDALVLPQGVLRTTIAPSFSLTSQTFDADGERQDIERIIPIGPPFNTATVGIDSVTVWSLNAAIEFGLTEQITVAAQWAPGWRFAGSVTAGDVEPDALPDANKEQLAEGVEKAQPIGLADLFIGAKAQILGPSGYVPNDAMRFAAAGGFIVPLSTYDPEEAAENQADGDEFQQGRVGNDVFAAGFRLYYDLILSDAFFWNLYTEAIFPFAGDYKTFTGTDWEDVEVKPGYELTFETDFDYTMMLGDATEFGVGLPITYSMTGEDEFDGNSIDDTDTQLLSVSPSVSIFLMGIPLPTELSLSYQVPLYGKNTAATSTLVLQIKNFLRF